MKRHELPPVRPPIEPWQAPPVRPPIEPWLVKLDSQTKFIAPW